MVQPRPRTDSEPPLLAIPAYRPAETFSDTTRRLCGAPYLDADFGNEVIREVVEGERKAVPPSYGFDLDPVVRHCLRARRLLIIRYAIVTALLVIGFCASPVWTVAWLGFCALVVAWRSSAAKELPRGVRMMLAGTAVVVLLCAGGYLLVQQLFSGVMAGALGGSLYSDGVTGSDRFTTAITAGAFGVWQLVPLGLAGVMFLTLFLSRRHVYGVITTELAPGAPASAPRTGSPRVERRLALVAAMQRGNVVVHETDPFTGAGWIRHSWSFAVPLKPADGDGRGHVPIDGSALNRHVHNAILALRDDQLLPNERIPNVFVVPYMAADGYRRADDPLIDPQTRTPRTLASPETIAAIESCPQGGLRHYLRAVIPANGKEVRTPDGRLVLPAQDSGIGVTAFVHLAVEGGMLYTEFVATVMPQVRRRFHLVDNLRPERIQVHAATDTFWNFVRENILGPARLVRLGWDSMRLGPRMSKSSQTADEFRFYDYGARFSVRELAAQRPTVKFLQQLDGGKYIKILDKVVTESVLEFLEDSGVDTAEYRAVAMNVAYDFSHATLHGQQNFGNRNVNIQNGGPQVAAARVPGGGGSRA
jgi:hypothetical protein